jgi:hypothetical protein
LIDGAAALVLASGLGLPVAHADGGAADSASHGTSAAALTAFFGTGGASGSPDSAASLAVIDSVDVVKVEAAKQKQPKRPTLRFLSENRDFFRARLDALLLVADRRAADGRPLDARLLRYREMLAQIHAARDSAAAGEASIKTHELLSSVSGIEDLEHQMDSMEQLLAAQHGRLSWLEEDFIGRQQTALVVVLSGVPPAGVPRTVVLQDADGPTYRVALPDEARQSLARGGATEVLHELFEPRDHRLMVSFEGDGWRSAAPAEIALGPTRDRLTFLEIDASSYDPAAAQAALATKTWTR